MKFSFALAATLVAVIKAAEADVDADQDYYEE